MNDLISRGKLLDSLPKNDTVLSLDVRRIVMDAKPPFPTEKED